MDNEIKRILFVITQSEFGGAQRFLYNLISRLDKSKYDIRIAIGDTGNKEFAQALKNINVPVTELKFLVREINPIKDIAAVFELRKLINNFCPDTVFLNSSKAGFVGSLAAKFTSYHLPMSIYSTNESTHYLKNKWKMRPKVVYRIGGWTFNDPWPKWKKWLWIILERLSARWKDYIIVNNKHDLEQAHELEIRPREKVVLIYNGLDVYKMDLLPREQAQTNLTELFLKLSYDNFRNSGFQNRTIGGFQNRTTIGTIANFYPSKGLKYLIEAAEFFKNNDDVVFIIIGDGRERKELENLIEQKCLQKKVLLSGQVPDAYKYLPAFDIFVLPSVKEGFPWVVIEAMAAKLPVIATKVGAVPEIIEDSKNGFVVEPGRPDKIAGKIQDLLNDDRLRQELGIQAHQTVLFKFTLDKMTKQIENLL